MQKPHTRPGSPNWYYYPYSGGRRLSPRSLGLRHDSVDVDAATAEMVRRGDHLPAAAGSPRERSLLDHLADYEEYRRARNGGGRAATRPRQIIKGCGFRSAADVTEDAVVRFVASLRGPRSGGGLGHTTANKYLKEMKWFLRWMVRNRRCEENPLTTLELFPPDGDVRFTRRDFTVDEQAAILEAARASPRPIRGLGGPDRYMLYRTAAYTGLRAGALASLTPASFDLAGQPPTVTVEAPDQKSRERHKVPLHSSLAAELRAYLAGRPADARVFPGGWPDRAAEMLRADLAAAGVPEVTPEGHAHFHSFRHTFTTKVARTAANPKAGMRLTGHKTASMFSHYTHTTLDECAAVIEGLDAAPDAPTGRTLAEFATDLERVVRDAEQCGYCFCWGQDEAGNLIFLDKPEEGGTFVRRACDEDDVLNRSNQAGGGKETTQTIGNKGIVTDESEVRGTDCPLSPFSTTITSTFPAGNAPPGYSTIAQFSRLMVYSSLGCILGERLGGGWTRGD